MRSFGDINNQYIADKLKDLEEIDREAENLPCGDRKAQITAIVHRIRGALCEMDSRLAKGGRIRQTENFIEYLFKQTKESNF